MSNLWRQLWTILFFLFDEHHKYNDPLPLHFPYDGITFWGQTGELVCSFPFHPHFFLLYSAFSVDSSLSLIVSFPPGIHFFVSSSGCHFLPILSSRPPSSTVHTRHIFVNNANNYQWSNDVKTLVQEFLGPIHSKMPIRAWGVHYSLPSIPNTSKVREECLGNCERCKNQHAFARSSQMINEFY